MMFEFLRGYRPCLPCGRAFYHGLPPIGVPFGHPKGTEKVPATSDSAGGPAQGARPLGTPKMWSKKQKAKTCRSAARFLTLFVSSPIDPSGAKNRRKLRCRGAHCAPVQLNDSARFHGRTLFAPTAHIRSDVGGGVAGSRSDQCPSGALNRTSGPALLDGGARCAPPSADAPSNARALRADMESAPTVRLKAPLEGSWHRR